MKKFIYSLMLAFMLMFAVCCGKDAVDVNEVFESVFEGVATTQVTENLELPTELDGVTIEWTSSHPDIVSNTGVVTRSNKDVVVTLTAKLTIDGEVTTLTKKIKVLADAASTVGVITVAEALAAELGAEVTIQGTVSDIYYAWDDNYGNMSVKVTDETGTIIAFRITEKVEIGYVIKVEGTITAYKDVNQIDQGSIVTVISSNVAQGETVKTAAAALAAKPGTKVEIEGTVTEIYQGWDSGFGNMSVYVKDSTGTILAFRITKEVQVGYVIKVEGTITSYNNVNQIAQGSTTTIISTDGVVTPPPANPNETWQEAEEFVTDKAYKFALVQESFNKTLFLNGQMAQTYYFGTTENPAEAVDVKVVATAGGYHLVATISGTNKYLELSESSNEKGDHVNTVFVDAPTRVWTYNQEYNTFTMKATKDGVESDYYLGTYGTYTTISASSIDKAATSFVGHLYEIVTLSDEDVVNADKEALELPETANKDFALPSEGAKGSVITWAVIEGTAITIEGTTAKVTRGTEDVTVKLTATISLNEATVTKEFTIVVKKEQVNVQTEEVTYNFVTSSTKQGEELNANTALALFNNSTSSESPIVSVETTKVYDGNGEGGAYANQSGFLKMGTSKANGVLKLQFEEGFEIVKVEISCHDWYKKSDQYPTNSNKVSVNGSQEVLAPYNTEGTPEVLTFEVSGDNYVEITSNLRIFIFSIKVYYIGGEVTPLTDAEKVAADKEALELEESVVADFALPQVGSKGSVITWAVTEGTAIAIEGTTAKVTRGTEDATVKLTATIASNEATDTKEFTVVVKAESQAVDGVDKIADVLAAAIGTSVTIQGIVSDIYYAWDDNYGNMSVKVTDETGTIIAFRITEKVEIGYVIKVVGTVDQYNNVNQIAQGSTVTIISSDVQQGETVKTVAEALAAKPGTKAEIEGEVVGIYQDWDAGYGNMSVYVQDSTGKMIAFRITEKVEIGYIIKVEGTITAYNNVNQIAQGSTTTVISTGVVLSDAEKVAADKEALELNEEVTIDFALESEGSKGSVITWEVTEGTAIVIEGTTAKVTRGTADATVKLTATITSGNETDTKVFTIVVKKVAEQPAGSVEVVYTFATSSTKQGSELNANTALTLLNNSTTSESPIVSVETTKVYDGNGEGGAYANQSGFLKMGTSKANGVLKLQFEEGFEIVKVEISCHDWYKKSDQYPTNSNKVSVNGSQEVLAPYNTEGTPEVLTFEVSGDNYVEITSNLRIFLFSIKITYEVAE